MELDGSNLLGNEVRFLCRMSTFQNKEKLITNCLLVSLAMFLFVYCSHFPGVSNTFPNGFDRVFGIPVV